ncbi:ankyrin repeat-containing protein NPR4-like [Syzygium oleosum]|uniref:ankyrin repeat-containing protein NPR4-like n=1 Tax=Syzygium oleosum TaxID=219896 RepID=UPI0011D1D3C5|nr:ankyrin repeat-containing protein NPR4-like [Syzygium oleosum]XP_030456497.1 ankyrin repeat-containing protein NPR4-like [Syzygium oleosum]
MCYAHDIYGRNPLHIAVVKDRVDVLKELVRESPHAARQKMGHGETILHLCVEHYKLEALKVLVESVGDHEFVNLKNDHGDTILHLAAAYKQTETISFLVTCTAVEVNSLNADSLTAHELLARSGKSGRHMDNIHNFFEAGGSTEIVHALSRSEMESMTMGALPPYANDQNITSQCSEKVGRRITVSNMIGLKGKRMR